MRALALVLLWVIVTMPALSQEETLISGDVEHGGFGGPVVKLTRVNGENAVFVGGRGGWIINHTFILGGGGYGLVTDVKAKTPGPSGQTKIDLGYGGVELEYVASSEKLVHTSFLLLVGAGAVSYKQADSAFASGDRDTHGFFIIEPAVSVHLNVTAFFRIAAGVSYRYVTGAEGPQSSNANLSGLSGVLTLEFGKF